MAHLNPKITIITPVLNEDRYLEQTIMSVISQNYQNLEYIIIDGGSTDKTVEIIEKYQDYISYWISEPDTGPANALNKGFAKASGEIMGWINANDILLPNGLNLVADIMGRYEVIEWLNGQHTLIDEQGRIVHVKLPVRTSVYSFMFGTTFPSIQQESTFWRRSLWDKSGGYISENISLAFDFELWIRFFRHAPLFYTYGLVGAFRHHEGQLSSQEDKYKQQGIDALNKERKRYRFPPYNDVLQGESPPILFYSSEERRIVLSRDLGVNNLPFSPPTHFLLSHYIDADQRSFFGFLEEHTYVDSSNIQIDSFYRVQDNERIDWIGYSISNKFNCLFEMKWYEEQINRSYQYFQQLSHSSHDKECVIVEDNAHIMVENNFLKKEIDLFLSNFPKNNPDLLEVCKFFTTVEFEDVEEYANTINQSTETVLLLPFWLSSTIQPTDKTFFLKAIYKDEVSDDALQWVSWKYSSTFFAIQIALSIGYKNIQIISPQLVNLIESDTSDELLYGFRELKIIAEKLGVILHVSNDLSTT